MNKTKIHKEVLYKAESYGGTYYEPSLKAIKSLLKTYYYNSGWAFGEQPVKISKVEKTIVTTTKESKVFKIFRPEEIKRLK